VRREDFLNMALTLDTKGFWSISVVMKNHYFGNEKSLLRKNKKKNLVTGS